MFRIIFKCITVYLWLLFLKWLCIKRLSGKSFTESSHGIYFTGKFVFLQFSSVSFGHFVGRWRFFILRMTHSSLPLSLGVDRECERARVVHSFAYPLQVWYKFKWGMGDHIVCSSYVLVGYSYCLLLAISYDILVGEHNHSSWVAMLNPFSYLVTIIIIAIAKNRF